MKISELIGSLIKYQEIYGDISVGYFNEEWQEHYEIDDDGSIKRISDSLGELLSLNEAT